MNLLLDTHVFVWWESDPTKISDRVLSLLQDRNNTIYLSVASAWEIQIKRQLGKLTLKRSVQEMIADQQRMNQLQVMAISLDLVSVLDTLPLHHKDPFDRIIIAQAKHTEMVLISHDSIMTQYSIEVIW